MVCMNDLSITFQIENLGCYNLAIRDGLSGMPSLFISACYSCAFVDGPGSWASTAVAWVQSSRSRQVAQKHFLSVAFPCSSLPTRIGSAWKEKWVKNIGIRKFPMVLLFMNLVQRNGAKETVGFVPLVSPWNKNHRNFNFHLSSFSNSYSWSTRLRDSSIIAL